MNNSKKKINKHYEELDNNSKTLTELIRLARKYKNKRKRNSDFNRLYLIIKEMEKLDNMVGMKLLKESIASQILYYIQNENTNDMLHTVIQGPPGTGKTEVAKILGKIYLKLSFLSSNKFITARRSDMIGEYLGQTSIKTKELIKKAKGGVLFIDEAYSLGNKEGRDSYSKECIDELVSHLSDNRDFVCIIAGYKKQLKESFFAMNPGLERRFPWVYEIEKYNSKELSEIFKKQLRDIRWRINKKVNLAKFFEKNKESFKNFGGDTEIFLAKCKISHCKRVFGYPKYLKFIFNKDDIENGYKLYIDTSKKIKKSLPPSQMYI